MNTNEIEVPFDTSWKSASISLSGGADSALLAYIVCKLADVYKIKDFTLHCISHTRMWKTKPWQHYDSLRVYEWLQNKFPQIKFVRHTNFIPPEMEWGNKGPTMVDEYGKTVSGDNIEIRAFAEFICHQHKIPAYYNGVTRNPRNVDFVGMPTRDIEPTDNNKHLSTMTHMGIVVLHPFRFVEKSAIVKKYIDLDIMELFNLTRSCEGEVAGLDYTNYQPGQLVPVCNECFWCKEREWAIKSNVPTLETPA